MKILVVDDERDILTLFEQRFRGMKTPRCIGILSAHQAKGRKVFGFEYDPEWIQSKEQLLLDPDIGWFSGPQFPNGKENFGVFLDSMPDRWGRMLLKRRAMLIAKDAGKPIPTLYDIDFLLGVQDESRMGALRFKLDRNGSFLGNDNHFRFLLSPQYGNCNRPQLPLNLMLKTSHSENGLPF